MTLVDAASQAALYYSDDFSTYSVLIYKPGIHIAMTGKSQTYRGEDDNAELRHYLTRLARRSRCFSRCLHALRRVIKLFVFAWNRRQRYRQLYLNYPAYFIHFAYP